MYSLFLKTQNHETALHEFLSLKHGENSYLVQTQRTVLIALPAEQTHALLVMHTEWIDEIA